MSSGCNGTMGGGGVCLVSKGILGRISKQNLYCSKMTNVMSTVSGFNAVVDLLLQGYLKHDTIFIQV